MNQPCVVLDTNVAVSALVFPSGILAELRLAWQSALFRPLASRETAAELIRVLQYPRFRLNAEEQQDLLGDYLPWCEVVQAVGNVQLPECRDPDDRKFLALAVAAKADALVSGDGDILEMAGKIPVPVLPPEQFRNSLREAGQDLVRDTAPANS